jgi:hypothetical protein
VKVAKKNAALAMMERELVARTNDCSARRERYRKREREREREREKELIGFLERTHSSDERGIQRRLLVLAAAAASREIDRPRYNMI